MNKKSHPEQAEVIDESNLMFEEVNGQHEGNEIDFEKMENAKALVNQNEIRRVQVPPHRMTPLKNNWEKIVTLVVDKLKLLIRMNVKRKCIEIKPSEATEDTLNLQRAADFLKAYILGFDLNDAIALLRMDDLYLETFEIKDIKNLHGDHLSRAIGRITGEKGKTKNAIENATKTRIVVAESKISLLGSYSNLKLARGAISSLVLGSPANKIYNQLRYVAKRKNEM